MNVVNINNFGPIYKVSVNLEKNMQVFIGPQASGKVQFVK